MCAVPVASLACSKVPWRPRRELSELVSVAVFCYVTMYLFRVRVLMVGVKDLQMAHLYTQRRYMYRIIHACEFYTLLDMEEFGQTLSDAWCGSLMMINICEGTCMQAG
jgi:hypothetical protein